MQAYEACLSATSTTVAPWYVVPADDKENARLIIAQIILDTFKALKMHYPDGEAKHKRELLSIRRQLMKEGPNSVVGAKYIAQDARSEVPRPKLLQ